MTQHERLSSAGAMAGSTGRLLRTALVLGVALGAGVWFAREVDQQRSASYPGHLQARMLTVVAEQAAKIREFQIQPGQRVKTGDPLLTLECDQITKSASERQQAAADAEQEAIRVKAAADLELHWRRRELQSEIFQTQFKLASLRQEKLHQEVEQLAWRESQTIKEIFSDSRQNDSVFKFLSESKQSLPENRVQALLREDAAVAATQALTSQITLCEQRLSELRTLEQGLESQIRLSHGVQAAEERKRIAREQAAITDDPLACTAVTSPGYGLAGLPKKQKGDMVHPGETLIQILDDDRRTVEVDIPSQSAVLFHSGQKVRLEFPGREERLGIVASVSPQTGDAMTAFPEANGDAPVRLSIEPAGKLWPTVSIGSRVLVFRP